MIGPSEKSGIEIKSEYQLTGHPVFTLEEMNACEREMSANVPRDHEMAL